MVVLEVEPRYLLMLGKCQIMDMKKIAAGEDAGNGCLERLVYKGTFGAGMQRNAGLFAERIFGDQPHRQKQRVRRKHFFGAGNRAEFLVDLRDHDLAQAFFSPDIRDRMGVRRYHRH